MTQTGAPRRSSPVRLLLVLLGAILATAALLELGVMALARTGWIDVPRPGAGTAPYWSGSHPILGVWHKPEASFSHHTSCFQATYHSNSVGARDVKRALRSDAPRVVVLGALAGIERRMEAVLDRLTVAVGDRRLAVVLVPVLKDFLRREQSGEDPLSERLRELGARRGFEVVKLLPPVSRHTRGWQSYFFSCDYHWSAFANAVAQQYVLEALGENFHARARPPAELP